MYICTFIQCAHINRHTCINESRKAINQIVAVSRKVLKFHSCCSVRRKSSPWLRSAPLYASRRAHIILFIRSSLCGRSRCSHLSTLNGAAVALGARASVPISASASLGFDLEVELLGHVVILLYIYFKLILYS